jgi:hypothetical protein
VKEKGQLPEEHQKVKIKKVADSVLLCLYMDGSGLCKEASASLFKVISMMADLCHLGRGA